jgi:hypothetical protein
MDERHRRESGAPDPVDWDAVHDGTASEEDFLRWAEAEGDSPDDEDDA